MKINKGHNILPVDGSYAFKIDRDIDLNVGNNFLCNGVMWKVLDIGKNTGFVYVKSI